MEFRQKIQEDLKTALKEKKELELSVLRLLNAAIINKEKEKRYKKTRPTFPSENLGGQGKEKPEMSEEELEKESRLVDEEVIDVISSEVKKRKEAILGFEKGKRPELVKKEKKEIEILQMYLPEQLSEEEIKKLARQAIEKVGAKEIKDMGKVMSELTPKVKGRADGSLASKMVKELLVSEKQYIE